MRWLPVPVLCAKLVLVPALLWKDTSWLLPEVEISSIFFRSNYLWHYNQTLFFVSMHLHNCVRLSSCSSLLCKCCILLYLKPKLWSPRRCCVQKHIVHFTIIALIPFVSWLILLPALFTVICSTIICGLRSNQKTNKQWLIMGQEVAGTDGCAPR